MSDSFTEFRSIAASPFWPAGRLPAKRIFDLAVAVLLLLVLAPLLLALCIVMMASGGPVFYRQLRVGRRGAAFAMVKFRTMVPDAQSMLAAHLASNPQAAAEWTLSQKLEQDPRVTRLGRVMRRFSLDELPQLWNVVRGDMSIVGPRPVLPDELHRAYGARVDCYLSRNPGLTGLWQVRGRSRIGHAGRRRLDRLYHRREGLRLDLWIVLQTVPAVLRGTGV